MGIPASGAGDSGLLRQTLGCRGWRVATLRSFARSSSQHLCMFDGREACPRGGPGQRGGVIRRPASRISAVAESAVAAQDTPPAPQVLPERPLRSCMLAMEPFQKPEQRLTTSSVTTLSRLCLCLANAHRSACFAAASERISRQGTKLGMCACGCRAPWCWVRCWMVS